MLMYRYILYIYPHIYILLYIITYPYMVVAAEHVGEMKGERARAGEREWSKGGRCETERVREGTVSY